MTLSRLLKDFRIKHEIISTPRQIGLSCSLSIKVRGRDLANVIRLVKNGGFANFPAIYQVKNDTMPIYIRTM